MARPKTNTDRQLALRKPTTGDALAYPAVVLGALRLLHDFEKLRADVEEFADQFPEEADEDGFIQGRLNDVREELLGCELRGAMYDVIGWNIAAE